MSHRRPSRFPPLLIAALLAACGTSPAPGNPNVSAPDSGVPDAGVPDAGAPQPPSILSFSASSDTVAVGEHAQLTAVFTGGNGEVEGLGPIISGQPLDSGELASTRTFTLTVRGTGPEAQATATVAARYRDRIRQLPDSPMARSGHLAMALPDGGALVMGGHASESDNVPDSSSSERFDAVQERFLPGPDLALRALDGLFTVAVPLPTGFLLAGAGPNGGFGTGVPPERIGQTFDPGGGRFGRSGNLKISHFGTGAAAPLADGRVLLSGGGTPAIQGAELFDPRTQVWSITGQLGIARRSHTATLLRDGRILIVGGLVCCTIEGQTAREDYTASVELYDPATGTFQPTGSLGTARAFHRATLLSDGRVLVTGGFNGQTATALTSVAGTELYDPVSGNFTPGGDLQTPRALHLAVRLTDGRLLVVGGTRAGTTGEAGITATELYDPAANRWVAGPTLTPAWFGGTATLLPSGKVLLYGGESGAGSPQASAALYE